ncbi:hypothetical protein [Geoanaerobacter pelophilus]|uniref:hypothetical protein n=1 Tax=Geoanaerobacter pelophilus TaxID=60036 RepID=UPI00117A84FE|nr:hypothetical protein [Geoanaerobacter pelophilus]
MSDKSISLADVQFFLIFSYWFYLYCRKRHQAFLNIALSGCICLGASILLDLPDGIKAIVLASGLVVGLILSYKELEALGKEGIDAKEFLNADVLDFVVLAFFMIAWGLFKRYY